MQLECSLLDQNVGSCNDPVFKGFMNTGVIVNFSKVATKTTDKSLITNLTLAEKGYKVYTRGQAPFEDFSVTGEEKKTGMLFGSQLLIYQKGLTPDASEVTKILSEGTFAIVLQQAGVTDNSKYPAIGFQSGLRASAVEWSDEEGGFVVTLDEKSQDYPVMFLWKDDEATTDSLVNGLLT